MKLTNYKLTENENPLKEYYIKNKKLPNWLNLITTTYASNIDPESEKIPLAVTNMIQFQFKKEKDQYSFILSAGIANIITVTFTKNKTVEITDFTFNEENSQFIKQQNEEITNPQQWLDDYLFTKNNKQTIEIYLTRHKDLLINVLRETYNNYTSERERKHMKLFNDFVVKINQQCLNAAKEGINTVKTPIDKADASEKLLEQLIHHYKNQGLTATWYKNVDNNMIIFHVQWTY